MTDFIAKIEIPRGSLNKFEMDKESGALVLDRTLPIPCPQNYGFLKNGPISQDGDPLDVFVISFEPLVPLSEVSIRPLGILICEDNGVEDNKVIAKIKDDIYQNWDYIREVRFYLENYKEGFKILDYKIFNDDILFHNFIFKPKV